MNIKENMLQEWGYDRVFLTNEKTFARIFGWSESLIATDTYQFSDYSKYITTAFDENAKAKRRQEVFPKDCEAAFDMGVRFVTKVVKDC